MTLVNSVIDPVDSIMRDAKVCRKIREEIKAFIMEGNVPIAWAREIVTFLCHIRSQKIFKMCPVDKKRLIAAFVENGNSEKNRAKEFITSRLIGKETAEITSALIRLAKKERNPSLGQLIWLYLFRQKMCLESIIKIEDIIGVLWDKDTLLHNTAFNYLTEHYEKRTVLEEVCRHQRQNPNSLPPLILNRLLEDLTGAARRFFLIKMEQQIYRGLARHLRQRSMSPGLQRVRKVARKCAL